MKTGDIVNDSNEYVYNCSIRSFETVREVLSN